MRKACSRARGARPNCAGTEAGSKRKVVPGSAVAPALALEGSPGAGLQVSEAKGRQVVSARASRSMARGHAVPRSVAQGVSSRPSRSRKKGCYAGAMSVNSTHTAFGSNRRKRPSLGKTGHAKVAEKGQPIACVIFEFDMRFQRGRESAAAGGRVGVIDVQRRLSAGLGH
jgi:hypothetical protein